MNDEDPLEMHITVSFNYPFVRNNRAQGDEQQDQPYSKAYTYGLGGVVNF